jgi:hypothetical protein
MSGDSIVVVHPLFQEEGDGSIPISPLQLHFGRCSVDTAIVLNEAWHSVFPRIDKSNVVRGGRLECFAAEYANRYYATAIWTRPIAANRMRDGDKLIELRRMAIAPGAPKNTASRFLAWMTRHIRKAQPDVIRLVSYQDTAHHSGTIYKAAGWRSVTLSNNADWTTHKRPGASAQSDAPKIRWELDLIGKGDIRA